MSLKDRIRKRPIRSTFSMATALALAAVAGYTTYVFALQPNPTIRSLPMTWQTKETAGPVLNIGVDANGVTLDQWKASGKPAEQWKPVEITVVWPGMRVNILRRQVFANKMADPKIQRFIHCGKVSQTKDGPIVDGDGSVSYNLGPVDPPGRTDGAKVSNYPTMIPLDIMTDSNGSAITQPRTCVYAPYAKFMKNSWQAVDVYFARVAFTLVPAKPTAK